MLKEGQQAQVTRVIPADYNLFMRLLSMGITAGTDVRLTRSAPIGGDPIVIEARGYSLSLRLSEARSVEVTTPAA